MKKFIFTYTFFCSALFSRAECYFSPAGDTLLYIQVYGNKKMHAVFSYFTQKPGAYELITLNTINISYTDTVDYFVLPDSLARFAAGEMEDFNFYNFDTLVKIDLSISKVKRTRTQKNWCSKGCAWRSWYNAYVSYSLFAKNKLVYSANPGHIYFTVSDYIEWGTKPFERDEDSFTNQPWEALYINCYWSQKFKRLFVRINYYNKPFDKNNSPEPHPVYFLI